MTHVHPARPDQAGSALILVLVCLTVLAMGALALVRITESSTLVTGNLIYRMNARMAGETGIDTAFAAVNALADDEAAQPGWYYPVRQPEDEFGIPANVDWVSAPVIQVGAYAVRYVVERMCQGAVPVASLENQCLLEQLQLPGSNRAGAPQLAAPAARQFRVTVQVRGPRNTLELVQSLVTRAL